MDGGQASFVEKEFTLHQFMDQAADAEVAGAGALEKFLDLRTIGEAHGRTGRVERTKCRQHRRSAVFPAPQGWKGCGRMRSFGCALLNRVGQDGMRPDFKKCVDPSRQRGVRRRGKRDRLAKIAAPIDCTE